LAIALSSCTLTRAVKYFGPDIRDADRFPQRHISAAPAPVVLAKAEVPLSIPDFAGDSSRMYSLHEYLRLTNTRSLLVVRGDSVLYEYYGEGAAADVPTLGYSTTKSYIGILVGIAIEEGKIESIEDPVRRYMPELDAEDWDDVRVRHLLQMTTGNTYREDENPLHENARFYLGNNLEKRTLKQKTDEPAGTRFRYKSGDSQLLTLLLSRAIAPTTVTAYLEEKLWHPLGAAYPATFNTDEDGADGIEKGFCCLSATARDQIRLGMAMRDGGKFAGKQVIPEQWIAASTRVDSLDGSAPYYQYQWWLSGQGTTDYLAEGILNQFVYVNPEADVVIVKQSSGYGVYNKWSFMRRIVERVGE